MLRLVTTLLLLSLAVAGCGTAPATPGGPRVQAADQAPAWVSLERIEGSRSVYNVTLFEDGKALYEGIVGDRHRTLTKTVPRERATEIFQRIEAIDLWSRPPRYDVEHARQGGDSVIVRTASPDEPWDILRAQRHARLKRIDGLFFAPRDLLDLKAQIEAAVDLPRWREQAAR